MWAAIQKRKTLKEAPALYGRDLVDAGDVLVAGGGGDVRAVREARQQHGLALVGRGTGQLLTHEQRVRAQVVVEVEDAGVAAVRLQTSAASASAAAVLALALGLCGSGAAVIACVQ